MYRTTLTLLAAALALAACADHPASAPADPSRELVITQGIAAPPARLAAPAGPRRSDLAAAATVNGSSTTPVSLNGQNCTTFPAQTVVVTYTVSGRQDHAASFQVNTKWVYDGTSFVGSVPTTVNVPARAASAAATIIPSPSVWRTAPPAAPGPPASRSTPST